MDADMGVALAWLAILAGLTAYIWWLEHWPG